MAQLAWPANKSTRQVRGASLVLLLVSIAGPSASQDRARDAVPVDPVTGIIEALKTHQVVAFGEMHGNTEIAAVRLALLRDPRFPDAVQDIVVEFGTPKHQDVIDRYVNGGTVNDEELERVWTDSQFPGNWSNPLYKQFYRTVREVNANLAASRRIRVVLGEPTPRTMTVEAELIRREVIEKGHTALLVFGSGHFARKPPYYSISDPKFAELIFNDPDYVSTVAHLDAAGVSVFSIYSQARDEFAAVQPDIVSWRTPALVIVKGTRLGVEPFARFAPRDTILTLPNADGKGTHQEPGLLDPTRSGLMQEQYDAVLVLGPSSK